ncbi:hypothetical protein CSPX01_02231 [Colletotrichum filicis]|nr:hypothetical protein CSPX01_02231 [Colletotrichum filicis]
MHSTARRNVDRPLGSENGLRLGPETPHLRALAQFSLANIPVVPPKARYLQKRGVYDLAYRGVGECGRLKMRSRVWTNSRAAAATALPMKRIATVPATRPRMTAGIAMLT